MFVILRIILLWLAIYKLLSYRHLGAQILDMCSQQRGRLGWEDTVTTPELHPGAGNSQTYCMQ